MIILVVIMVGVAILVVLFRAKKRKQQLEINKLHNVMTEDIEMELKPEGTIEKEANSSADQPPYAEIHTEAPPSKSEELVDYLNQNNLLTGEYSEIELEPADSKHTLPSKPPRQVNLSNPIMESNPIYQSMDQCCDSPSYTNIPQGTASDNIYTTPDIASSQTVETETINPSLFMGQVGSPSDSQN